MERRVSTSSGELVYELTKKKIKKMYLRVKEGGRIVVSVPTHVSVRDADSFVKSNEAFIQEALTRLEERAENKPTPPQFATGDEIYAQGEKLVLEVTQGFPVSFEKKEGVLVLTVLNPLEKTEVEGGLREFYTQEMREVFLPLMDKYQNALASYGIPQAKMKIRDMKSQWGSCNRRNNVITLNSRLIHLPFDCIDYVVLHEFCHFVHGNHSKDFYDLVSVFMPDWKPRRQLMKQWGQLF